MANDIVTTESSEPVAPPAADWDWLTAAFGLDGPDTYIEEIKKGFIRKLNITNLKSVFEIAEFASDRFIQCYGKLFGESGAEKIHDAACKYVALHKHETTFRAIHDEHDTFEQHIADASKKDQVDSSKQSKTAKPKRAASVSFQSLFHEKLDTFCEPNQIEDCASPAAYEFDLLRMIDHFHKTSESSEGNKDNKDTDEPVDLLKSPLAKRRKDLFDIRLSANELKHEQGALTLLNPLLENAIVSSMEILDEGLYEILSKTTFPILKLPFHQPYSRLTLGLQEKDTSWHEILLQLDTEVPFSLKKSRRPTLRACLGLSPSQLKVLLEKDSETVSSQHIGDQSHHSEKGVKVSTFCQAVELSRTGLHQLLGLGELEPKDREPGYGTHYIQGKGDKQGKDEKIRIGNDDFLFCTSEQRIRMSKMIRLQHWTGMPFDKLDTVICLSNNSTEETESNFTINELTFDILGLFRYLQHEYHIELDTFIALIAPTANRMEVQERLSKCLGLKTEELMALHQLLRAENEEKGEDHGSAIDKTLVFVSLAQWFKQQHLTPATLQSILNNGSPTLASKEPIIEFFKEINEQLQPHLLSDNSFKEALFQIEGLSENTRPIVVETDGLVHPSLLETSPGWNEACVKVAAQFQAAQTEIVLRAITRFCAVPPELAPTLLSLAAESANGLEHAVQLTTLKEEAKESWLAKAITYTHSLVRYASAFSLFGISATGASAWRLNPKWFGCEDHKLSLHNLYQLSQYTDLLSRISATELQVLEYLQKADQGLFGEKEGVKEATALLAGNDIQTYWKHWEEAAPIDDKFHNNLNEIENKISNQQTELSAENTKLQVKLSELEKQLQNQITPLKSELQRKLDTIKKEAEAKISAENKKIDSKPHKVNPLDSSTWSLGMKSRDFQRNKKLAAARPIQQQQKKDEDQEKDATDRQIQDFQNKQQEEITKSKKLFADKEQIILANLDKYIAERKALKATLHQDQIAPPHTVLQLSALKRLQKLAQKTGLQELMLLELAELYTNPTLDTYSTWNNLASELDGMLRGNEQKKNLAISTQLQVE